MIDRFALCFFYHKVHNRTQSYAYTLRFVFCCVLCGENVYAQLFICAVRQQLSHQFGLIHRSTSHLVIGSTVIDVQ